MKKILCLIVSLCVHTAAVADMVYCYDKIECSEDDYGSCHPVGGTPGIWNSGLTSGSKFKKGTYQFSYADNFVKPRALTSSCYFENDAGTIISSTAALIRANGGKWKEVDKVQRRLGCESTNAHDCPYIVR